MQTHLVYLALVLAVMAFGLLAGSRPTQGVEAQPDPGPKGVAPGSLAQTPLPVQPPKLRATLSGNTAVVFTADGKTLACVHKERDDYASKDQVKLWDVATAKELLWDIPAGENPSKVQPPEGKDKEAVGKNSDGRRFIGTWRIAKWRSTGVEDFPAEFFAVARVTFKDGTFILSVAAEPPLRLGYELVCEGKIDLTASITARRSHGIYKFEGNDHLVLCFDHGDKRPIEITAAKSDGQALGVLDRAKPGEEKPTAAEIAKFKDAVKKAGKLAPAHVEVLDFDKGAARSEAAVRAIEKMGGGVSRDDDAPGKPVIQVSLLNAPGRTVVTDEGVKVLKEFKGLQILSLGRCFDVTDEGLKEIKDLKCLVDLELGGTKVTDAGMRELKGLQRLTTLFLYQTKITDTGLKELKGLEALRALSLHSTKVTAEGLRELKGLKSLEYLDLSNTPVTAAGLKELKELNALKTLVILNTGITDAGLKELKETLPHCEIIR